MPQSHRISKNTRFGSNHSSAQSSNKLTLQRQDSIHSERRREIKHTRKASYFTKAQKIQEGLLSDDDSIVSIDIEGPHKSLIDHNEEMNLFSDEAAFFDDNFVLDTTQELPIRKPQSAYVIFGKLVSEKLNMSITLNFKYRKEIKSWGRIPELKSQKLWSR